MLVTWFLTVPSAIRSATAISLLLAPAPRARTTATSRSESPRSAASLRLHPAPASADPSARRPARSRSPAGPLPRRRRLRPRPRSRSLPAPCAAPREKDPGRQRSARGSSGQLHLQREAPAAHALDGHPASDALGPLAQAEKPEARIHLVGSDAVVFHPQPDPAAGGERELDVDSGGTRMSAHA